MEAKEPNCDLGYKGQCCCNCKHQIQLRKHPFNSGFGSGSIMDVCGWVCLGPELTGGTSGIYFEKEHGLCEMYTLKTTLINPTK